MRLAPYLAGTIVLALSGGGNGDAARCPVQIEHRYYAVYGNTLDEIKRSIRASGPVDPDGRARYARTDWKIQWSWGQVSRGAIDPSTVSVTCKATVTLPKHNSPQVLSAEELARWKAYELILETHEMNHVRHVEAVAPQIALRIKEEQDRAGSVSARTAQAIAKRIVQMIQRLDRSYDQHTRHGATEGV